MMVKPLAVVLLLLGALVSETRAQSCDPVLNLILKVNVCLGIGVGVDSTHSILASLSLPPTHTPIPQVPVRPPTPHAPTRPPSSPPAHPPSSPGPKAPPPSTPQPPASPPSTPRPPAPSPSTPRPPTPLPSTPQAPPPQPSSICCQQVRNMAASSPTTTCRCLRGLISVDIVHKVLLLCGIDIGVNLCVNL